KKYAKKETKHPKGPEKTRTGPGQKERNKKKKILPPPNIDTARGSPIFTRRKRIKLRSDPHQSYQTPDDKGSGTKDDPHIGGIQGPHGPACHQVALVEVGGIMDEHHHCEEDEVQRNAGE